MYANVAKQYLNAAAEGSGRGISIKHLFTSLGQRRPYSFQRELPAEAKAQVPASALVSIIRKRQIKRPITRTNWARHGLPLDLALCFHLEWSSLCMQVGYLRDLNRRDPESVIRLFEGGQVRNSFSPCGAARQCV